MDTQVRIGKDRIGKDNIYGNSDKPNIPSPTSKPIKHKHGEYNRVLLTEEELNKLKEDFGEDITNKAIKKLDEYIEEKRPNYKNHNLTIRRWVIDAVKEEQIKNINNYETRDYDMDDLEEKLIENTMLEV